MDLPGKESGRKCTYFREGTCKCLCLPGPGSSSPEQSSLPVKKHGNELEQQFGKPEEMVTINLEGAGHLNGVSYCSNGRSESSQKRQTQQGSPVPVPGEAVDGNRNFSNWKSLISTSCHAIQGKLCAAGSSSVERARSLWNGFQAACSTVTESVLALGMYPNPTQPLWTLRVSSEYTVDDEMVTDTEETKNFPSRDDAELYLGKWLEQVRKEGQKVDYVVELFPQINEDSGVTLDTMHFDL